MREAEEAGLTPGIVGVYAGQAGLHWAPKLCLMQATPAHIYGQIYWQLSDGEEDLCHGEMPNNARG